MDQQDDELSALIKEKAKRYQAPSDLRNLIKANLESAPVADADIPGIASAGSRLGRSKKSEVGPSG